VCQQTSDAARGRRLPQYDSRLWVAEAGRRCGLRRRGPFSPIFRDKNSAGFDETPVRTYVSYFGADRL